MSKILNLIDLDDDLAAGKARSTHTVELLQSLRSQTEQRTDWDGRSREGVEARRTTPKAALFLSSVPPCNTDRLVQFLGDFSVVCNDGVALAEFVPWHNGRGILHRAASIHPNVVVETGTVVHSGVDPSGKGGDEMIANTGGVGSWQDYEL